MEFIMIKKYRPYILLFYVLAAAGLIAAAFVDLKLDILLNNPENPVAIWFRNTGEIPSRLICPLAGAVLFYTCEKRLSRLAGLFIELGGSVYMGYYLSSYFFVEENMLAFGLIYGLGFGLTLLFIGKYVKLPKRMADTLKALAVVGVAVMAVQLITVEGMKYLWGRVRFRDLLAAGSYDAFTPWYHLNGINGNKSFPSGHTAGAGMSFLLMLLPYASKKLDKKKPLCFFIPMVYTCIVAFTRLVMGAHYLSDVTMGAIISFTIVLVAMAVFERKQNLHK